MNLIEKHIDSLISLCKQHKVQELYIFGSILTSGFSKDSDIDMLVQFENVDILEVQEQKTKKTRRIKINGDLNEIINRVKVKMRIDNSNQYIFLNKYRTKPIDQSYVNVKLKEILRRYNIVLEGNASSHFFRKTLGNRVLKLNNYSNESILLLMEVFSHSNPNITKRYLGIREKEILDVYDSLSL